MVNKKCPNCSKTVDTDDIHKVEFTNSGTLECCEGCGRVCVECEKWFKLADMYASGRVAHEYICQWCSAELYQKA